MIRHEAICDTTVSLLCGVPRQQPTSRPPLDRCVCYGSMAMAPRRKSNLLRLRLQGACAADLPRLQLAAGEAAKGKVPAGGHWRACHRSLLPIGAPFESLFRRLAILTR